MRPSTLLSRGPLYAALLIAVLATVLATLPAAAVNIQDTRMLADPAVSGTHVAFVYANDIWVVPRDGGQARRLTSHEGRETNPRFSPDGRTIAFSGQYDGNVDVFVVPVEGGVPQRLTWHPGADRVEGFTPDGSAVLFTSRRAVHTNRYTQLFTVPVTGGLPTQLPIPNADHARYKPDGTKIAYLPIAGRFYQWKNYRGGTTARIWIYDVADHSVGQVPQPEGRCNDADPAWIGDTLYFRSDRDGEFNLYRYQPGAASVERLTDHQDFPVLALDAGGDRVAYEQAGYLHLFDPQESASERLRIAVAADLVETRPRYAKGAEWVRDGDISPSGARLALEFRGEIVTVPAEKGYPRYLSQSPGAHDRSPAWSPDGSEIAYLSDDGGPNTSGEYGLVIAPQDGKSPDGKVPDAKGPARRYELNGAGFYEDLKWSPDGDKISYADNSRGLYWIDVSGGAKDGTVTKVSSEPYYSPVNTLHHAWSPDSAWLTYTRNSASSFQTVYLYSLAEDRSRGITDGLSDVGEPVFDAGGKYLWMTASTDAGPLLQWFAQSNGDDAFSNDLYLVVLAADEPSPLAQESDEEKGKSDEGKGDKGKGDEGKGDEAQPDKKGAKDGSGKDGGDKDGAGKDEDTPPPPVRIDFDRLHERILTVPTGTAVYAQLTPGKDGQIYYLKRPAGIGDAPLALYRYDLAEREETELISGLDTYHLAAGKEKVAVRMGEKIVVAATSGKIDPGEGTVALDGIAVKIEPRAEWQQILREVWRINRDYFYDPGMHGADWPAMWQRYSALLPELASRNDLNRLIQWMCSELSVGHHFVFGGDDLVDPEAVPGGLLGADYEIADGRYRFARVFGGLNWTPDLRSPLTEPGVAVAEGEYLLAVNGRDLRPPENLYQPFENTAGKIVEITVGPNADGSGARTVQVTPIADEGALRNRAWVEGNLQRVTEATDGRVAYVYVPDTANRGLTYFKRYFYPQAQREGIIIDERFNGGGSVADYYIDLLRRPFISYWATRYGNTVETPIAAIHGPKAMIIDETAGSGGDLLPWMFHKLELGTLIGKRTWGGLVGILGFPVLMDGGFVTAPNLAIWTEDGFVVENVGVPPDIEVEQLPAEVIQGHDPQLEKAIAVVMEQLEAHPRQRPERPPFPVRVRQ